MDNKDLGSKKMNNEQQVNEGFSGENMPDDKYPTTPKLDTEIEKDRDGNAQKVERARNVNKNIEDSKASDNDPGNSKSIHQNEKTVENKDRNSDVASNRYPNSDPENHKNRGNMKLDQD